MKKMGKILWLDHKYHNLELIEKNESKTHRYHRNWYLLSHHSFNCEMRDDVQQTVRLSAPNLD